jgi:MSHA biogenesis protein MshK
MAQRLTVLAACCFLAGAASAQPLLDPTRPPAARPLEPRASGPAPATRLQSILVSSGRSIAVIDGRPVGVGERIGDATVVSIEPQEVTLQRGAARETLKLLPPGVDKRLVKP